MSAIKSKFKPKRRRVTFSLISPDAKEVILMGDFNQWNPKIHPMKKNKNGFSILRWILPSEIGYGFKPEDDGVFKKQKRGVGKGDPPLSRNL